MKLTIIINYIFFIFILHLILINVNIHSKLISFENNKLIIKDYNENYVPNFSIDDTEPETIVVPSESKTNLKPSSNSNISHKDKLLNFINSEQEAAPSNYYSSDDNSSNFKSNVLSVDKFYKVNENQHEYKDLGKNDSKYSDFNSSCDDFSTNINDLRMGYQ
mgnify:CR=1 FL=1